VEAPLDLPQALGHLHEDDVVVVDCLTLWLSNLMLGDRAIEPETAALRAALTRMQNQIWLVSNEVGLGIVPENALARRFRDAAGRLHQQLAAQADHVVLMVAGLPVRVK
jgi:adenosylcobinamide kinase/adenosylcobinamide-phosphate guanylyltransferase